MAKKSDTLEDIHDGLAKELLRRVKDKSATASDLNVARQFLKDNGIEVTTLRKGTPMASLADKLPFAIEASG